MSRATECLSWNSLMSTRTMAFSSSNRNSASARPSSVLPTPVGPRKMKLPMGRLGSCRPARARRMAFATASRASSWPTTRRCSRSSMWMSFSTSPSSSLLTGMPVHLATTSAMSSSSTSSFSMRHVALQLVQAGVLRRQLPLRPRGCGRSGARRPSAGRPRARRARPRSCACVDLLLERPGSCRWPPSPPASGPSCRPTARAGRPARPRWPGAAPWRPRPSPCCRACCSMSSCLMRRSTWSISMGMESISMRSRLAASSTRSMALSGRKRSEM